jgi:hypothetical protein
MTPTLRRATVADDAGIRAVFAASFPDSPKLDEAFLRWQYWDNPFAEVHSWVWEDDGVIVAHYAGLPVPVVLDGVRTVAAVGVDAATAPSHRGQGLFEGIARAVYEDCGRDGIPVTMCFPNENSLRGFVKAGGFPVAKLHTWVRPPLLRTPRGRAREVEAPPDGLDDLWTVAGAAVRYGVIRDAAWWKWRYADRPGSEYRYLEMRDGDRLVGACALVARDAFGRRFTYLLELVAASPAAARALVNAACRVAKGTTAVALVALPDGDIAGLARAALLMKLPRRAEPKPLNFGVADNAGNRPDLAAAAWSVQWGDLDHL